MSASPTPRSPPSRPPPEVAPSAFRLKMAKLVLRRYAAPAGTPAGGPFVTSPRYPGRMLKRLFLSLAVAGACLAAAPAFAATPVVFTPQAVHKLELTSIMGRWYEAARVP